MNDRELAARICLLLGAPLCALSAAPAWLTAPLALTSLALTADLLVPESRRAELGFRMLAASASAVVLLIMVGLFLGLSGIGLRPGTWNTAIAAVGLAVLAARRRRESRLPRWGLRAALGWALVIGLVAAAFATSVMGAPATPPRLELYAENIAAGRATVTVRGGRTADYELRVMVPGATTRRVDVKTGPDRTTTLRLPDRIRDTGARIALVASSGRTARFLNLRPGSGT